MDNIDLIINLCSNKKLTFEQLNEFCNSHKLIIKSLITSVDIITKNTPFHLLCINNNINVEMIKLILSIILYIKIIIIMTIHFIIYAKINILPLK